MRSLPTGVLVLACVLLSLADIPAQVVLPVPPPAPVVPQYRFGLIDSRPTVVEVIPAVPVRGLEILGVVPGSPAGRAGLEVGDVILAANAARIITPDDMRRALVISGGRLRLKVYQAHTEQVLNVPVVLGPEAPGPGPAPITVTGRLRFGVVAVGGETTGITLTTADGSPYDLDFSASRPPDPGADGRTAVVTGTLMASAGPERPGRSIIRVSTLRLLGR